MDYIRLIWATAPCMAIPFLNEFTGHDADGKSNRPVAGIKSLVIDRRRPSGDLRRASADLRRPKIHLRSHLLQSKTPAWLEVALKKAAEGRRSPRRWRDLLR